ncbi:hypothetical protein LWI28_020321 [Acer negundo]|uniref:B3 domain-containing protein n=1 Tax=Acer negundo TaxID=4023 RepID=A0AAD5JE13_ACENE|nr:hypothetical protein LWI28_020321 [Acer negundo]KAK4857061.1 hypothetical protein QYF36_024167 [Acer negundo]
MRSLEELKSIDDGGSFDLLVKEKEKAANGDEPLKLELLTDSVLPGFIDMHYRKAMERKRLADEAFRKETNINNGLQFRFLNFKIPKKTRSRVPVPAIVQDTISKLESQNSSSVKRGFVGVEEEDEEIEKKPLVKKQRKADHSLEKKKKKNKTTIKKKNLDDQMGLNPRPVIPQQFQDEIDKLNGTDVMLVGQKTMTSTDMDRHQGRFSIPRGKVRNHAFLREEDDPTEGVKCSLIQPCLKVLTDLEFKKWTMNTTFSYTLIKKWNSVACNEENVLQPGCLVQLWSFRVGSNLWFALVNLNLKREDNVGSSSTGITNI